MHGQHAASCSTQGSPQSMGVHNYMEQLVFDGIRLHATASGMDGDSREDVACIALNQLAPRYIRHDVDMAFYMTPAEQELLEERVALALDDAVARVHSMPRRS
ncbi:late competence development ComFB family protein [Cobetia sp. 14N.309.X.WAT.E.A4]|nr:late competence development ComFB family protein [Cobetia sp. 14N.309.X.WAT.E.A4]